MRDFREKGAGKRDEHSHPLSDPSYFNGNGCYLTHAHNHITWVVTAMNSCVPKTVYFIHQGKYILGLGKEQNILI